MSARQAREPDATALLSDNVLALRRSGIREMMDLADVADDGLHLEIGEPDFPTPPHVIEAAAQAMQDGQVKYTLSRGTGPLREAIASKLRAHNSIPASTDDVVVTTGGTTAVLETLLVLLRIGDGVLIPDPGWPSFDMIVTLLRGRVLRYGLRAEADYTPDLEEVERLAPQARVLVINTPSNPTGAVLGRETLEGLIRIAERHGLVDRQRRGVRGHRLRRHPLERRVARRRRASDLRLQLLQGLCHDGMAHRVSLRSRRDRRGGREDAGSRGRVPVVARATCGARGTVRSPRLHRRDVSRVSRPARPRRSAPRHRRSAADAAARHLLRHGRHRPQRPRQLRVRAAASRRARRRRRAWRDVRRRGQSGGSPVARLAAGNDHRRDQAYRPGDTGTRPNRT